MRTLASLLAATAIAAFGFTTPASAGKPVNDPRHAHFTSGVSAPFIDIIGGVEATPFIAGAPNSKGELDNDGRWAVETGDLTPAAVVNICLDAVAAPVTVPFFLRRVTVDANGDILAQVGNLTVTEDGVWQAPSLQIYPDPETEDDCDGTLIQETGTDVMIDAD